MPPQPPPAYIHTLTSSFASTLDEIPQDMCRHFADLRELDAVLSQSLSGITKRIDDLSQRIEDGLEAIATASADSQLLGEDGETRMASEDAPLNEEQVIGMFQLLHEIADDTGRIKLGGEDKIRVASLAAEHMNAYYSHLLGLTRRMYDVDPAYAVETLSPYTVYPHVPPNALAEPAPENRRGVPRRTVAVQNNSYNLPMSAQNTAGTFQSSRNDGASRVLNGDTPNKRRRIPGPALGSGLHASSQQRDRDMDTDEHSTPPRGNAAQDAEAYRPGGNTGNRGRAQGRRPRDGRTVTATGGVERNPMPSLPDVPPQPRSATNPSVSNGLQLSDAGMNLQSSSNGVAHKGSNGRHRVASSHVPRTNPNPQPNQYPVHYPSYGGRTSAFTDPPVDQYGVTSYPPNANMNPLMDAAAYHPHNVMNMNMNPNLNQYPRPGYQSAMGIGMMIPPNLPPPPPSGTSRPSSASALNGSGGFHDTTLQGPSGIPRNVSGGDGQVVTVATAASSNFHSISTTKNLAAKSVEGVNSREGIKDRDVSNRPQSSSASGGLMSTPMLTSLPPVANISHPLHAPAPNYPEAATHSHTNGGNAVSTHKAHDKSSAGFSPEQELGAQPSQSAASFAHSSNGPTGPSMADKTNFHQSMRLPTPPKDGSSFVHRPRGSSLIAPSSTTQDPLFRSSRGERQERDTKEPTRTKTEAIDGGLVGNSSLLIGSFQKDESLGEGRNTMTVDSSLPEQHEGNTVPHSNRQDSAKSLAAVASSTSPPYLGGRPSSGGFAGESVGRIKEREPRTVHSGSEVLPGDRALEQDRRGMESENWPKIPSKPADQLSKDAQDKAETPIRRRPAEELWSGPPTGPFSHGDLTEPGEGQTGEEDFKVYCICGRPSFGQMIGCDDSDCEFEWYHLDCLGITGGPPPGEFVCPTCKARRAKGNRKSSKRKGNGGGSRGRGM